MTPINTDRRGLVERLKQYRGGDTGYRALMDEAADAITQADADIALLREALRAALSELEDSYEGDEEAARQWGITAIVKRGRKALATTDRKEDRPPSP